jgi:hypothetical protein
MRAMKKIINGLIYNLMIFLFGCIVLAFIIPTLMLCAVPVYLAATFHSNWWLLLLLVTIPLEMYIFSLIDNYILKNS